MIVTKTPLRVSFVGGGLDHPEFFADGPVHLLGATVNQYVYVTLLPLVEFAEQKYRFTYRVTDNAASPREIRHPVVRAALLDMDWDDPINIGTMADLPGGTGLGSSSAFTVGLLHALKEFRGGGSLQPGELAREAIRIEREVLGEAGGWQDQVQAAFGGLRLYTFHGDGFESRPLRVSRRRLDYLSSHLYLVSGGATRNSSVGGMVEARSSMSSDEVRDMSELARRTAERFEAASSDEEALRELAWSMNQAWLWKQAHVGASLAHGANALLDSYSRLPVAATKLCGNGVDGFILRLLEPGAAHGDFDLDRVGFPVRISEAGSSLTRV